MSEHPTSAELRYCFSVADGQRDRLAPLVVDALNALAACEAERDRLQASEAHAHAQWSEEKERADRYREALETVADRLTGCTADDDYPAYEEFDQWGREAREALRGDS